MAASKSNAGKAAPPKGAAARAETADQPEAKTVEYDGLTIALPDNFPPELLFDLIEEEANQAGEGKYISSLRTLRTLAGRDQFIEIRNRIGGDPDKVLELLDKALEQYGLTTGESKASSDS